MCYSDRAYFSLGVYSLVCGVSSFMVVVVVVVVLTLTRIVKSVVTGQAPVTLELRNTPGKNTNNGIGRRLPLELLRRLYV